MKEDTAWSISAMHIKTPSQQTKIQSLSGGNQQKVILGRWLLTDPEILLLDEPTRGIDVGAKYEIYELISDLATQGRTVLMVSGEMPELLGVCTGSLSCRWKTRRRSGCGQYHPGRNHDTGCQIRIRRREETSCQKAKPGNRTGSRPG